MKVILKCKKCQKETFAFDDNEGMFVVDFFSMTIIFVCPYCLHENIMNLGSIESLLKQKSQLPKIGNAKY